MDNFDQSTYQGAFGVHGNLNVEHPIVKHLTNPETPVNEAKDHFDNLVELSQEYNISAPKQNGLRKSTENLYNHFLHPIVPWNYPDESAGSFSDHVVNSALNSENSNLFHYGVMSPYLKPKHLEKAINSKFLDSMPVYFQLPTNDGYSRTPFGNIIEKVSRENTSSTTKRTLIDKILNAKFITNRYADDASENHWRKMSYLSKLTPVMSNEDMHHVLDHGILDESNIKTHGDQAFRLHNIRNMSRYGDDSVRDKVLEKHPLLDQNEDGSLGNQTDKRPTASDSDDAYRQNNYIDAMIKYGNVEQKNKILIQLKNKNYQSTKDPAIHSAINLNNIFSDLNNEQRHFVIANFHPSAFDVREVGDALTIAGRGTNDQVHHFVQRMNTLNIKIPANSHLRRYSFHPATKELMLENDKIKES
jgi:hypothetical protein